MAHPYATPTEAAPLLAAFDQMGTTNRNPQGLTVT